MRRRKVLLRMRSEDLLQPLRLRLVLGNLLVLRLEAWNCYRMERREENGLYWRSSPGDCGVSRCTLSFPFGVETRDCGAGV